MQGKGKERVVFLAIGTAINEKLMSVEAFLVLNYETSFLVFTTLANG